MTAFLDVNPLFFSVVVREAAEPTTSAQSLVVVVNFTFDTKVLQNSSTIHHQPTIKKRKQFKFNSIKINTHYCVMTLPN